MFIYIFTGQETKKEIRNAKASLTPVQSGKTSTELPEPLVINVHQHQRGSAFASCLHQFLLETMTNPKVLFMAFSHPSPEEIESTASKYITMEFIFSNPLQYHCSSPLYPWNRLSDKQQNLAGLPTTTITFNQWPNSAKQSTSRDKLRALDSNQPKWGRRSLSPAEFTLTGKNNKIQESSLLSLISTLRKSPSWFNSCIIFG